MDRATLRGLENQIEAGDETALVVLWQSGKLRYRGSIAARVSDKEDQDDLQQEAFINTLKSVRARRFKLKQGSFSGWTGAIANNVAVDFCRRKKVRTETIARYAKEHKPCWHQFFPTSEIDENIVHHVMSKMKQDDIDLFRLIYVAQMSLLNIASYYGVPLGTVKSWLFRVRKRFLNLLIQEIGEKNMKDIGLLRKAS